MSAQDKNKASDIGIDEPVDPRNRVQSGANDSFGRREPRNGGLQPAAIRRGICDRLCPKCVNGGCWSAIPVSLRRIGVSGGTQNSGVQLALEICDCGSS
jgi:hypothetical protein